jgi:hypothetical protein
MVSWASPTGESVGELLAPRTRKTLENHNEKGQLPPQGGAWGNFYLLSPLSSVLSPAVSKHSRLHAAIVQVNGNYVGSYFWRSCNEVLLQLVQREKLQ